MSTRAGAKTAAAPADRVDPLLVDLREVSVEFRSGGRFGRAPKIVRAVDGVTLGIARGSTLGLVGGTGSGKSTVAHVVVGMLRQTGGTVLVAGREPGALRGRELAEHRRRVQVVMQDPYSSLDPRMRAADIIAEPLTLGYPGRRTAAVKARVAELLSLVGLPASKANLYPHQFSGGQRQRIAIARALAPDPDLIVLDEPTSALDVSVRAQILNLLKSLQDRLGVTYLVISHDLVSVSYLASTVAVMHQGRIVESGPTTAIYETARHPYTQLLLASVPTVDGSFLDVVQPARLPSGPEAAGAQGCHYRARCVLRERLGDPARCVDETPALLAHGPNHVAACHFAGTPITESGSR